MPPEDLYQVLRTANRLPTPPGVAIRILQLVESEDTTLEDLTQVISSDPALTAKILKYINSPLVGLGFHGSTLQEAVARIGVRGTQMMALSFSLISPNQAKSCPSFDFDRFWSESLARGVAARRLSEEIGGWDGEEGRGEAGILLPGDIRWRWTEVFPYQQPLQYCSLNRYKHQYFSILSTIVSSILKH